MRATILAPRKVRNATTHIHSERELLEMAGYRIGVWGWLDSNEYIKRLSHSKVWFATTEAGEHVGTRFYEVMMSGRALLLCNRAPHAYAAIGLVEGQHAAMFNSSEEAQEKVLYYLRNEDERLRLVANARAFVREHHSWEQRATEFVELVRGALGVGQQADRAV